MPRFQYGHSTIDYSLQYQPDQKDITVAVDWANGVSVRAPENIDQAVVERVLHKKAPWILQKVYELNEIQSLKSAKEFLSGEKFPYLGRQYRLKVDSLEQHDGASLIFQKGRFLAKVPKSWDLQQRQEHLKALFRQWYITHGHAKAEERLRIFCPKMECYPSKLVVKDQQARWGSCTKKGTIHINWKIFMAPMRIVDYVVVHELAHLKHPDHSTAFWSMVQSILPDYGERKEWLRIHGPTLTF
ncbi:M48 family metallopeptidase [Paenactinomyces guangxiensis]|uniref:M48 family metallopeptidase n=1 Tax=Paenactinomyces guangxiensis TaxID=1490290 RepID=A0A7W1WUQ3_9BACL|nr:SprT family zinc-dependent metalloprotease [Paenactinomyces guangxiensis]MBA4496401.1 M48 family metallopeptidase [Paenactinomyces guangxiensis]MBH8593472.1 M48 family metallopeptidase [Paenactinomyces guangxiensis]